MLVWSCALGVALVSAGIVWPLRRVRGWSALSAVAVPVALSSLVYWAKAFNSGQDADQYATWAPAVIGMLAAPGTLLALVTLAVAERRSQPGTPPGRRGEPGHGGVGGREAEGDGDDVIDARRGA